MPDDAYAVSASSVASRTGPQPAPMPERGQPADEHAAEHHPRIDGEAVPGDPISEVFPPDDPTTRFVVSMAMASNDLDRAFVDLIRSHEEEGQDFTYRIRLSVGHLAEAIDALNACIAPGLRSSLPGGPPLSEVVPSRSDSAADHGSLDAGGRGPAARETVRLPVTRGISACARHRAGARGRRRFGSGSRNVTA